ncbi:MAG: T9SS type A sorting domain-containing protein [Chitinispirillaceae bacterium]|nr:T9SS type A sorting domain-containing protein [Chitinispirillaceae bacterium]
MTTPYRFSAALLCSALAFQATFSSQSQSNYVDSKLYEYNNDGAWCWFQDERAVIDTVKHKLIVGSTNMQSSCDVVIFGLENMRNESSKRFGRLDYSDDHNAPAVVVAPNGNYIAMWAHHYDSKHHYSIYSNGNWSNERTIEWSKWANGQDYDVAYSNLYYLSDEKRIYNLSRTFNVRSPHFVYSDDNGGSWEFGGQLTTHDVVDTYNRGYYKYWGNGTDRIDMCFTEEHPRDQKTSIYHGYIQDHKLYDSEGNVADEDIYDEKVIPTFESFTKVFAHSTKVNGVEMGRCWQHDIARYDNGVIVILFKARANDAIDDHRNFYARYDGNEWKTTYIGKAGRHIYGDEHDYVGLGAVNPDDPNRIYICSAHNPGDDNASPSAKREIWRGTTKDNGETWKWEPVTANSSEDNWRPIVPKWKPGKEALLWFKGVYTSAQNIRSKVIGTFYEYDPPEITAIDKETMTPFYVRPDFKAVAPHPGAHRITMQYTLPEPSTVTLQAFSVSGKRVATLVDKRTAAAGAHTFDWDTKSIPGGIYLVRVTIGDYTHIERVTVEQ